MTAGEVKFIYNPMNGLVIDVTKLVSAITGNHSVEKNPYQDIANEKISVTAPVTDIVVSASGDVTVTTEDGSTQTVRASAGNGDMVYVGGSSDDAEQSVVDTKSNTVYKGAPDKSKNGSNNIAQPVGKNDPVKYAVTFLPHFSTTIGGMDIPGINTPTGNYNTTTIGGTQIYIPWKSVEKNKIDRLVAAINGPPDSIHFITKNDNMVMTAPGDKSTISPTVQGFNSSNSAFKQLLVTGVDKNDELKAWYPEYTKKPGDTVQTQERILAAQVNVAAYDKIILNVCLVEVNGAAVPNSLPVEAELNTIYASSIVQWKVSTISNFTLNPVNSKNLVFDNTHPNNNMGYNDQEKQLNSALETRSDYDSKTLYLFFIDNSKDKTLKGYMPFNRQYGYIYHDNQGIGDLMHTIGHELGHGAFGLKNVYDEYHTLPQDSTDNLMDKADGTKLWKIQWDAIHNATPGSSENEENTNEADKTNLQSGDTINYIGSKTDTLRFYRNSETIFLSQTAGGSQSFYFYKRTMRNTRGKQYKFNNSFDADWNINSMNTSLNSVKVDLKLDSAGIFYIKARRKYAYYNRDTFLFNDSVVIKAIVIKKPIVKFNYGDNYQGEYGFDKYEHSVFANYYDTIKINNNLYYVPWLSLYQNQSVHLKAEINVPSLYSNLKIEFKSSNNATIGVQGITTYDSTNLKTGLNVVDIEIIANRITGSTPCWIKVNDENNNIIGKLKVESGDSVRRNCTLIKIIADTTNAKQINLSQIRSDLTDYFNNNSYNQAFINWGFSTDSINLQANIAHIRTLTTDTGYYNYLIREYKNRGKGNSPNHHYIFISDRTSPKNNGLGGLSPSLNYTQTNPTFAMIFFNAKDKKSTYVHEIGHTLTLEDLSKQYPSIKKSTENFMDYIEIRNMFWKWQIKTIH
jgi:hypothetical protein